MFFGEKNLETRFRFGNPNQSPIANAHTLAWVVFLFLSLSLSIRNSFLSSLRFSSLSSPFFYWIYPEFLLTISRSKLYLSLSSISDLVLESCLIEITVLHCDRKLEFFGKDLYCRHLILKFLVELEKVVAIGSFERCEVIDR